MPTRSMRGTGRPGKAQQGLPLFIRRENPDAVISAAITLIQQKLPDYVHAQPGDIQVLTPMRKGALE